MQSLDQPGDVRVISIETQSDDAHRLLATLTTEPAYVFGSSIGALIGLDLVQEHQEQVHLLIAHEPPLRTFLEGEILHGPRPQAGEMPEQTIQRFAASLGMKHLLVHDEGGQVRAEDTRRRHHNTTFFLSHEAPAVNSYEVNLDRLRRVKDKITFAGG